MTRFSGARAGSGLRAICMNRREAVAQCPQGQWQREAEGPGLPVESAALPLLFLSREDFLGLPPQAPKGRACQGSPLFACQVPSLRSLFSFLLLKKESAVVYRGGMQALVFPNLARAPGEVPHGLVWFGSLGCLGPPTAGDPQSLPRAEKRPRESSASGSRHRHAGALMTCLPPLCALRIPQPPCNTPVALPSLTCEASCILIIALAPS